MITSHISHHGKYPLFLSDFNETRILDRCSKSTQISNFMKTLLLGAELFRADGRKDTTRLIVDFRNFVNVLETWELC